ncbi:peptidase M48 family protein [Natrialba magadii ATCC 43099]|uniref:Peptidase M48 Ste24p n=1 Tax=Natrialba magadii (strain ATCC 43099 / DSM 3394 / CCM 3739 / CIP 104546 / IAM 13178 / JCM 8861 / NBRC 102185 / NCIMB 2190 / MS3) TaxID=547559 RepID=D3SRP1_NATMM|nr:M48 family metalloprotease [Natrialba magadii]ADD06665.1 peptidase M48 family protein [Natrialba magadii ATCC 43099]ELY31874.1 peptidase M48 Ste24p [Natrialba magadii ATCC 43099]
MPPTPNRQLQIRIAGALALVIAVNGVLLAALAWSAVAILGAGGWSVSFDGGLPVAVALVLVSAVALVAMQARYGTRTVVSGLDMTEIEGDGPRTVGGRVRRLAAQADVPLPSVAVADRDEPACLTVGTQRSPTIVVTTGLLDQLDDDELDAALAHEVAHIANRDLPVVTAVAAAVAIGDRLLERERKLRGVLEGVAMIALFSGIGAILFAVPILVLAVIFLLVSTVARVVLAMNSIALGLFSKTREYAADRGASQLTGDPAAVASALAVLDDECNIPTRDARLHASATLGIVPQPLPLERAADDDGDAGDDTEEEHWFDRWFVSQFQLETVDADDSDESESPGYIDRQVGRIKAWIRRTIVSPIRSGARRVLMWRPPTHPSTESRIERLQADDRRYRR